MHENTQFAELQPIGADSTINTRFARGQIETAGDVVALRRHVGLTQKQFALAMGISVHTLRNWEQGRRSPDGPALALLRIAAKHPAIIRDNVQKQKEFSSPRLAEATHTPSDAATPPPDPTRLSLSQ